jgi:hypothetical protein
MNLESGERVVACSSFIPFQFTKTVEESICPEKTGASLAKECKNYYVYV